MSRGLGKVETEVLELSRRLSRGDIDPMNIYPGGERVRGTYGWGHRYCWGKGWERTGMPNWQVDLKELSDMYARKHRQTLKDRSGYYRAVRSLIAKGYLKRINGSKRFVQCEPTQEPQ